MTNGQPFSERYGAMILLLAGVIAWLGAIAAAIAEQEAIAVTAIPTGAALLGAAAYYSRVRKFAGVELAEQVLEVGGAYEAVPDATPTEAVQDFAQQLAGHLTEQHVAGLSRTIAATPYFLHVSGPIPRGMIVRGTWEGTEEFAQFLESEGWEVARGVQLHGAEADLVATRENEQLWIEVKGVIYALNPALIRETAERFPDQSDAAPGVEIRRALFLPVPPIEVSPEALDDFRQARLELWYGDARDPRRFVRAA